MSNARFYNAWEGPIWQINATAFGHADCLDSVTARIAELACKSNGHPLEMSRYKDTVASLMGRFANFLVGNDTEKAHDLAVFNGTVPLNISAVYAQNFHGYNLDHLHGFCQMHA